MTPVEFLVLSKFSAQDELRRSLLVAFFHLRSGGVASFKVSELCVWLSNLGYAKPNATRLKNKLKASKMFVSGNSDGVFKIHAATVEALDSEFPGVAAKSDEISAFDSIIPESLLQKDRTFVRLLIRQINASYENNIFDGCAVLMRRLLEICLIMAYENLKIEADIKGSDGAYKQLNSIIDNAKSNKTLALSRNSKESLEPFRALGNFSAHKIYYNAHRKDVESKILEYKALIEELLYKGGLRT